MRGQKERKRGREEERVSARKREGEKARREGEKARKTESRHKGRKESMDVRERSESNGGREGGREKGIHLFSKTNLSHQVITLQT